ncbi:MAG TPA: hypothetical protein VG963_05685, partial [Polyangiaceae bacterium]|nr:hypothetical protein [Polyangiaceae bacterium]
MAGHAPPRVPQIPQLALQQIWPAAQVLDPHATPASSASQVCPALVTTQCVPARHARLHTEGTHCGCGGHGARMHWTWTSSQVVPAAQRTVSHE